MNIIGWTAYPIALSVVIKDCSDHSVSLNNPSQNGRYIVHNIIAMASYGILSFIHVAASVNEEI